MNLAKFTVEVAKLRKHPFVHITFTRIDTCNVVYSSSFSPKKHTIPEYSLNMFTGYRISRELKSWVTPYLNDKHDFAITFSNDIGVQT